MAEQVIFEDGQWDALKLPNSSKQDLNGLPCGTQSNSSLLHDVVLPNGPLPSGTPLRKRARAACDRAEGSPSEDATTMKADPDEQPAAVRVCRQSTRVQAGTAPVRSVEGTPAGPVVYCFSHRSVQERMSPAESTTAYGKEPDPPALAKYVSSAPGNYKTHQEDGRPCTMIKDKPASLINISMYFDRWLERYRLRSLVRSAERILTPEELLENNLMAQLINEAL
jgi:hypothetical protein